MTSQNSAFDLDTCTGSTHPAYHGMQDIFITHLMQFGNFGPARPFTVGISDSGTVVIEDDGAHTVTRYDAGSPEAVAFAALLVVPASSAPQHHTVPIHR